MSGSPIKLGPFKGGLNNVSDPTSISDTELSVAINWDYDVDGTLISRPALVADSTPGPVVATNVDIIGWFVDSAGASYMIGSTNAGIYYKASGVWTLIVAGFKSSAATQYLDKMWIVAEPGSGVNGGSWSPSGGWTTVATMPKGMAVTTFKERLWIAAGQLEPTNGSRLYFSAIADGTTWNPADFIDINKGDGQKLLDIYSLSSNLYCFKSGSTYVLQYDSSPTRASVNSVSRTIGVESSRCIVQYENILYVFHKGYLYELINYTFNKVNIRTDIGDNASGSFYLPVHVSLVNNRVIVFYYGNIYVFYLFTRTWSRWDNVMFGRLSFNPTSGSGSILASYTGGSNAIGDRSTYTLTDGYTTGLVEPGFEAELQTKIYDFNSPNLFKKLYWWGADVLTSGDVIATVTPVIYSVSITWDDLAALTWDDVAANTWARPLNKDVSVTETISTPGAVRKFLKFMRSIRFRNVIFTLKFTVTDWANPTRVYSISPVVATREQVTKDVN
jgi:hypothetical protein